ncbi:hypothetical protein ACFYVL_24920 [Streptomyces sp. NPDC004111]|uniref:hypothetical protein n=1 Tax=Streptomyces sp. NPDC004111 TaxID=3364690 RepID=UPI0036B870D8
MSAARGRGRTTGFAPPASSSPVAPPAASIAATTAAVPSSAEHAERSTHPASGHSAHGAHSHRRPAGAVGTAPRTDGAPPLAFAPPQHWVRDEQDMPAGAATLPRPAGARGPARLAAVAACVVLGVGLIGGAAAGSWLAGGDEPAATSGFAEARTAWHSIPVDTLFPRALKGDGAGPGGADRAWTRVAVAPDGDCANALDPLLLRALGPVGCERLLRATYTDATTSSVTTVGMVFTRADEAATNTLRNRFTREKLAERGDLMPRTFPVPGTVAAGFGDGQRASWTVRVLQDVPVVVYAVSGFADGRTVTEPQPAGPATVDGATTAPAQSGLGHEAKGIADRIERGLRKNAGTATEQPG